MDYFFQDKTQVPLEEGRRDLSVSTVFSKPISLKKKRHQFRLKTPKQSARSPLSATQLFTVTK